jgi:ABC-type Zn2+ transport system substrate-binding protein/surface adhesin
MMINNLKWAVIILILPFISCKNSTSSSDSSSSADKTAVLKEALTIQDDAIHIGMEVDSLLAAKFAQGAVVQNIDSLRIILKEVDDWKYNMVKIPGMEHDHDHAGHDHAGHDHSHDHEGTDAAANLTPEEIKKVQEEWKAAIEAIYDKLK